MRTNVYIDAFNLYYGSLKGSPYRWLDLRKLCEAMLPKSKIHKVRVFLAKVEARPNDPQQPVRQQTYIRALETIPGLTVHYGQFLTTTHRAKLVNPTPGADPMVDVWKTEEKGSDVNLASFLLCDGFRGDYEAAVVISNDSDLAVPVRIVKNELKFPMTVLNPYRKPNPQLRNACDLVKQIRPGVLALCQLPPTLTDANGTITKPASW